MIVDASPIRRRSFIKAAAPCLAFGLRSLVATQPSPEREQLTTVNLAQCRAQLLELINVERGLAGVPPVAIDELACQVESRHALDMVTGDFLSHWGTDGLKPYQRYSLAGGTDYTAENVSSTDHILSVKPERVAAEFIDMNIRMHAEKPPNDGHRRAILAPEATHVGFGIALNGKNLRLAEMFIARYTQIEPIPREVTTKAKLVIKGKLLDQSHVFQQADVFFEPLPTPDRDRRMVGLSYGLPEQYVTLRPIPPPYMQYPDGSTGSISLGSQGRFRVPVTFRRKKPGIYTIVIWIKKRQHEKAFPVTEICIRAQ